MWMIDDIGQIARYICLFDGWVVGTQLRVLNDLLRTRLLAVEDLAPRPPPFRQ